MNKIKELTKRQYIAIYEMTMTKRSDILHIGALYGNMAIGLVENSCNLLPTYTHACMHCVFHL